MPDTRAPADKDTTAATDPPSRGTKRPRPTLPSLPPITAPLPYPKRVSQLRSNAGGNSGNYVKKKPARRHPRSPLHKTPHGNMVLPRSPAMTDPTLSSRHLPAVSPNTLFECVPKTLGLTSPRRHPLRACSIPKVTGKRGAKSHRPGPPQIHTTPSPTHQPRPITARNYLHALPCCPIPNLIHRNLAHTLRRSPAISRHIYPNPDLPCRDLTPILVNASPLPGPRSPEMFGRRPNRLSQQRHPQAASFRAEPERRPKKSRAQPVDPLPEPHFPNTQNTPKADTSALATVMSVHTDRSVAKPLTPVVREVGPKQHSRQMPHPGSHPQEPAFDPDPPHESFHSSLLHMDFQRAAQNARNFAPHGTNPPGAAEDEMEIDDPATGSAGNNSSRARETPAVL